MLKVWIVRRKLVWQAESWNEGRLQAEWEKFNEMKRLKHHKFYYKKTGCELTNIFQYLMNWDIFSNMWLEMEIQASRCCCALNEH